MTRQVKILLKIKIEKRDKEKKMQWREKEERIWTEREEGRKEIT